MMHLKHITSIALTVILASTSAYSQTDSCVIKLKAGNASYERNEFDRAIVQLNEVLDKCRLDNQEKIGVYKILILSFISIDNLEEANRLASQIMKIDPNFKPDKTRDDPRLSGIFLKFKPTPISRIGFYTGLNLSSIKVQNTYSVFHNDSDPNLGKYSSKTGFDIGFYGEHAITGRYWVGVGLGFQNSGYSHTLFNVESTTIHYSERLSYLTVPIQIKREFGSGNFTPWVSAGGNFSYLISAIGTSERDDVKDLTDRRDYRYKLIPAITGSLGVSYNKHGMLINAGIGYIFNFRQQNNPEFRFSDPINVFKYYYVDDDFILNTINFHIGISQTIGYKNKITKP